MMLHPQNPRAPESSPRHTLIRHAVALLDGSGLPAVCGLIGHPSAPDNGGSPMRVVAAADSPAVTAAVLLLPIRRIHRPVRPR
jgi:hypothetical protein